MKKLVLLSLIFSHITFPMENTENDYGAEVQGDVCDDNCSENSLTS